MCFLYIPKHMARRAPVSTTMCLHLYRYLHHTTCTQPHAACAPTVP